MTNAVHSQCESPSVRSFSGEKPSMAPPSPLPAPTSLAPTCLFESGFAAPRGVGNSVAEGRGVDEGRGVGVSAAGGSVAGGWSAAEWVGSAGVARVVGAALLPGGLAGVHGDAGGDLDAVRALGASVVSELALVRHLQERGLLEALASLLLPHLKAVAAGAMGGEARAGAQQSSPLSPAAAVRAEESPPPTPRLVT